MRRVHARVPQPPVLARPAGSSADTHGRAYLHASTQPHRDAMMMTMMMARSSDDVHVLAGESLHVVNELVM
jgi:hypothetical protein